MAFDPEKWQCAGCGRTGTLAGLYKKAEVFHPVLKMNPTGPILGQPYFRDGIFEGYVCSRCRMKVTDTDAELIEHFVKRR